MKPSSPHTGSRILGHRQGGLLPRATASTAEHTNRILISTEKNDLLVNPVSIVLFHKKCDRTDSLWNLNKRIWKLKRKYFTWTSLSITACVVSHYETTCKSIFFGINDTTKYVYNEVKKVGAQDWDSAGMLAYNKGWKIIDDLYAFSNAIRLIEFRKIGKILPKCVLFLLNMILIRSIRSISYDNR